MEETGDVVKTRTEILYKASNDTGRTTSAARSFRLAISVAANRSLLEMSFSRKHEHSRHVPIESVHHYGVDLFIVRSAVWLIDGCHAILLL